MAVPSQLELRRQRLAQFGTSILCLTVFLFCGCGTKLQSIYQDATSSPKVDASWPGQPPSSSDKLGLFYGGLVDLVAAGLIEVSGGPAQRETGVVICRNRQLNAAQAEVLASSAADIFLPNLEILQPGAARALAKSQGILNFGALRTIAPAAAAELAGERDALVLSSLTQLSAESAAGLAGSVGPLKLDGLESLEPGVAVALARHIGHLSLNGLQQLAAPDAAALARHHGDLCLNGLPSLSLAVAEALAGHSHGLHLNTIGELSQPIAAALSRHRGWCLGLNGLRSARPFRGPRSCRARATVPSWFAMPCPGTSEAPGWGRAVYESRRGPGPAGLWS